MKDFECYEISLRPSNGKKRAYTLSSRIGRREEGRSDYIQRTFDCASLEGVFNVINNIREKDLKAIMGDY